MALVIVIALMTAYKIVLEHGVAVQKYLITMQMQMVMDLVLDHPLVSVMHMLHQVLY